MTTDATNDTWPANRAPDDPAAWERFRDSDREAGFVIGEDFERFSQRDDVFNRAWWDETVHTPDVVAFYAQHQKPDPRSGDGFTQWDFALLNAAWSVARDYAARGYPEGRRPGFLDPFTPFMPLAEDRAEMPDIGETTARIKQVARFLGADLVGVTEYDERWTYTAACHIDRVRDEKPNDLPDGMTSVIVLGHGMDHELVRSYPAALAAAATGREYSREAAIVSSLASFIRSLGYEAIATSNDTALTIPYAIKAGMGEYGRNQMVITPEFGPRVRFSKVITSLPLTFDRPRKFGVTEFCNICQKCADACPPKALPYGPPTDVPQNRSTIRGVTKWSADCEKCFKYWTKMRADCAICMRVCPYNIDYSRRRNRLKRRLMGTRLRRLMLKLNLRSKQGERRAPKDWWKLGLRALSRSPGPGGH
jgi:epoxyqueuosine reductase QueG